MNGHGHGFGGGSGRFGGGYPLTSNLPRTTLPPHVARQLGSDAQNGAVSEYTFDATRVVQAGGDLASQILTNSTVAFEELYRALPEEGMFDPSVSRSNPFAFTLGAYTVPDNMALLVFNLRPDVYRFSGIDPGDYVPVEPRRFGSIMGFDLTIAGAHQGQVNFQIEPVPIQRTSEQAFQSNSKTAPVANAGDFARARAGSLAVGQGSSQVLLPQRPTRFGAPDPIPFTLFALPGQSVEAKCVIFRPMPTPIAFIEFDITGVLVPQDFLTIQHAVKYPQAKGLNR